MDWLYGIHVIPFFSFYLALVFLFGTWMRLQQYRAIVSLVVRLHHRWPNLTRLVLAHRHIFLTWETMRPTLVVLALLVVNSLAGWFVWPQAQQFEITDLIDIWPVLPVVIVCTAAMVAFDVYGALWVGQVDQAETEKYFDMAESWLSGWKAPVVRIFTLGYVNPRQMVAKEVRTALEGASALINSTLRWLMIQTTLRIACGLSLWGSYALQDVLKRWLGVVIHTAERLAGG
jgi:hypothetical protein